MKRIIATVLASLMLFSVTACGKVSPDTATTSTASASEEYLMDRLGTTDGLILGTAEDATAYGIDMSDFRDDGYVIRSEGAETLIFGKTEDGLDRAVRYYVKNCTDDGIINVTYGEGYRVKHLTVMGYDISEYAIIYDSEADYNGMIVKGADELAYYIKAATGVTLPVYSISEYDSAGVKPTRVISLTVDYPALNNEAFTIEVENDGNISIKGGRVRGCLYGAYGLLEDIGWRFLDDAVTQKSADSVKIIEYLYESDHVDITSATNRTEIPTFDSRRMDDESSATVGYKNRIIANWYSGHGLNRVNYKGTSFDGLDTLTNQPCLSDEEILERVDEYVLSTVENAVASGQVIGRDFFGVSIGQYDGDSDACYCELCCEIIFEEKSSAGLYVRTANREVQLLIDNGYDNVHINVLAYMGSEKPPQITMPHENVRVAYCFFTGKTLVCNAHTIDGKDCSDATNTNNINFGKYFEGWAEICAPGALDVWYYPFHSVNAIAQAPMVTNLYEDIKYLKDHGVKAIINTVFSHNSDSQQGQVLIAYLLNEMCWQFPESRDEFEELIREWFFIQYGDGWEYLYEYFCEYERLGRDVPCYNAFIGYSPADYVRGDKMSARFDYFCYLFDTAMEMADTAYQCRVIEKYKANMLFLCVGFAYDDWYVKGTDEEKEKLAAMYSELYRIMTEHHLNYYCNIGGSILEYVTWDLNLQENPFEWLNKIT